MKTKHKRLHSCLCGAQFKFPHSPIWSLIKSLFPLKPPRQLWKTLTLQPPQTPPVKMWDLGDLIAAGHIWGREAVGKTLSAAKTRHFKSTSVMGWWASASHGDKPHEFQRLHDMCFILLLLQRSRQCQRFYSDTGHTGRFRQSSVSLIKMSLSLMRWNYCNKIILR